MSFLYPTWHYIAYLNHSSPLVTTLQLTDTQHTWEEGNISIILLAGLYCHCPMTICSYGEQIRYVRHKCYLTSIRNLLSRLHPGCHMPSVGISVWTGLDPRRVSCGRDSDAQVSQEISESQIS